MPSGLFAELRRRNVFRVAAAYLAIAWLVLQIADTLSGFISIPEWLGLYLLVGLVVGFPIAVFLAWAYELTPEGLRAEADAAATKTEVRFGGRKLDFVIIGALMLVIILLLLSDRIVPPIQNNGSVPLVSNYTQLTQSQFVLPPEPSPYPIVPNASRVFFNDVDVQGLGVRQVSRQGGEAIPFDTTSSIPNAEFMLLGLTPDESHLAMNRVGFGAPGVPFEYWLFPLTGGQPRLLGRAGDATYSHDGSLIAFESEWGVISVANADLSEPREVMRMKGRIHWMRFSPDGKRLRFNALFSDAPFNFWPHVAVRSAIWEIDLDGGESYPVYPEWEQVMHCCGVWTPDGRYYVFQSTQDDRVQFWAANEEEGDAPVQITSSALDFRRPAMSPDGKSILAISWQSRGEVARYDERIESFVTMPGFESVSADQLSFSADGEHVAYVTFPQGSLWASGRDGSAPRQLTFPPMKAAEPVWSPDGESIAFVGSTPDGTIGVYVVSSGGGPATSIGDTDAVRAFPDWTGDSTAIVYMQAGKERFIRHNVSTGESTEIAGSEALVGPRVSPDGGSIAARSREGLVVLDLESGSSRVVADDGSKLQWYYWGDDQHLYLVDWFVKGLQRTIWRINIESGVTETIAVMGNTRTSWTGIGLWVGIDPDGAPIVLKDTSIHHIYQLDWLQ